MMKDTREIVLERVSPYKWRIPRTDKMRVEGIIYANDTLIESVKRDNAHIQVANVAYLPGIQMYSLAMPDIHYGYGFPIGGVAAVSLDDGVISPGGVGYDINCGVRVLTTSISHSDIKMYIEKIIYELYNNVPCGVGAQGKLKLDKQELKNVVRNGAKWAIDNGFGWDEDLNFIEENGRMEGAEPDAVSGRAYERGKKQLGTLGAGNHFLEIQVVDEIFDESAAEAIGIEKGNITVMIHTGSRGFGHQVCSDYVDLLQSSMRKYKIQLPDNELASVPINSPEGKRYFSAMKSAANFAWANREIIQHWVRKSFSTVIGASPESLGMHLIYDVAHNIAKIETHNINGKNKKVCVHRKGATRAFPPGHPDIPEKYRKIGQPVLIPGDMGTYSYILVGTEKAMEETFGSTCHGAGRVLSRHKALKITANRSVQNEMKKKGIIVKAKSSRTLREEVPDAYKNIDEVIDTVEHAGISRKIVRLKPIGVIKG